MADKVRIVSALANDKAEEKDISATLRSYLKDLPGSIPDELSKGKLRGAALFFDNGDYLVWSPENDVGNVALAPHMSFDYEVTFSLKQTLNPTCRFCYDAGGTMYCFEWECP